MSLTSFKVSQSNIPFIFSSFILIFTSPITTPKNFTSLTFYLNLFGFIYKLFSTNLFTTFSYYLIISFLLFYFYPNIIYKTHYFLSIGQVLENLVHHCLEHCQEICKFKEHYSCFKQLFQHYEYCLLLVFFLYLYIILSPS